VKKLHAVTTIAAAMLGRWKLLTNSLQLSLLQFSTSMDRSHRTPLSVQPTIQG
jgi:hypothetical protein